MKSFRPLLYLCSLLCLGCTMDQSSVAPETHFLISELDSYEITYQEGFDALLDVVGVDTSSEEIAKMYRLFKGKLSHRIRAVAISYHTVDPQGNPIVSAGAFYYPLDDKAKGVAEVPPIAHMNMSNSPSMFVQDRELYEEAFPALLNYITINPDMIGGNLTGLTHPRAYLHNESVGVMGYHMRCAVAEYLYEHEGLSLPNKTTLLGYSLGGSSALALAKYYQENVPSIKISEVISGGGIYDPLTVFQHYAQRNVCPYPAIPAIIISMNRYYNLNLDYTKIFTGGLENSVDSPDAALGGDGYAYWFNNLHTSMRIAERWGSDLHAYMHPDFFNDQLTGEFAKLQACLEENSIAYTYKPNGNIPIKIMHSLEDNLIPYTCSDVLYKQFKSVGADISLMDMHGDHYNGGSHFIIAVVMYLLLK